MSRRSCCSPLKTPALSNRVSRGITLGGVFPILYSRPHFLHHTGIMEITERPSPSLSRIESHSRAGVRIAGYRSQFVEELRPAGIESAGGQSSLFATCVMGAGSQTNIVHFFSVALMCVRR